MGKFIDLTGEKHNMLTVLERIGSNKYGEPLWSCRCDCGNMSNIVASHIRSGHTKSCGCLGTKTHGMTKTRIYTVWRSMVKRCHNPQHKSYHRYGGRGIAVCDEWRHSFETFRDWALANNYDESAPRGQYTIERKDNNGNYEPSNCRWATIGEQARNRRNNRIVVFHGDAMTLTEASVLSGINRRTLSDRVARGLTGDALFRNIEKGAAQQ